MRLRIKYSESAAPRQVMVSADMGIITPPTPSMLIGYLGLFAFPDAAIVQPLATMKTRTLGGLELDTGEISLEQAEELHSRIKETMKLFPYSHACEDELQKEFETADALPNLFNSCWPDDLRMSVC